MFSLTGWGNKVLIVLFLLLFASNTIIGQPDGIDHRYDLMALTEQLDPGWFFYPYFLTVELEHGFEEFYMSRVEIAPNGDVWAIGGGETFDGEYEGMLFRYRDDQWEVVDDYLIWSTEDGAGVKALALYIQEDDRLVYSSGYHLKQYDDGEIETFMPTGGTEGMPLPVNNEDEYIVDIIQDDNGKFWILTSYSRLITSSEEDGWGLYDHENSPLPEPGDDNGITTDLPARHLAITDNTLWITTHHEDHGLIKKDGDDWEVLTTDNSDLPGNLVSSIIAQPDDQLWISTLPTDSDVSGGGLVHIEDDEWNVYTTADGLPDDYVRVHAYEEGGYLWASFGGDADQRDLTHYGYLAEYDGDEWALIAEEDEFYDYLGWLTVDANGNKWLAGDFNVVNAGIASLNQNFVSFTDAPDSSSYFQAGADVSIGWESGRRVENATLGFSGDGGETWDVVESGLETDVINYSYSLPDEHILDAQLRISIEDDEAIYDTSEPFTILHPDEPYYHLRSLLSDGSYEMYDPLLHGWNMKNDSSTMFPEEKWGDIEYEGILAAEDVFDGQPNDFPTFNALIRAFGEDDMWSKKPGVLPGIPSIRGGGLWGFLIDHSRKEGFMGVCHGFAVSTLLAFSDGKSVLNNFGVNIGTENLYSAEVNNDIRKMINMLWVRQFSRDHFLETLENALSEDFLDNLIDLILSGETFTFDEILENGENFTTPNETLDEVKEMLNTPASGEYYQALTVITPDAITAGHSVTPYKVEQSDDNPDIWKIYIHDSNMPDNDSTYVEVDTETNYYSHVDDSRYFGEIGLFLSDRTDNYLTTSTVLKELPENDDNTQYQIDDLDDIGYMFTLFGPDSDIRITDIGGNVSSLEDNFTSSDIPGAFPIIPLVGDVHDPIGYFLVDLEYDVELEYPNGGEGNFMAFTGNTVYGYKNYEPQEGTTDNLRYGNSLSVYGNGNDHAFDVEVSYINDTEDQMFRLRDMSVADGDSVNFYLENGNELDVSNYGASIELDIELRTDFGPEYFLYENLELDETAAYKMVVDEWEDIAEQELTLKIDTNMDGEYDDEEVLTSIPTSKGSDDRQGIPEEFGLYQNYPNPFNPATTIRFALPEASNVELVVYDMLGREVETLVDGYKEAGYHEVVFDAGNLASGTYIYRIHIGNFMETKRLMLVK